MKAKHKEIIWVNLVIAFYIVTAYSGIYDITTMMLWPILAVPMSLLLIKTGKKELVALVGVMLAIIVSFIGTGRLNPIVISVFLLFVLAPAFVSGTLYHKKASIPRIIIGTTIMIFLSGIIFLSLGKILGIEYLEMYFTSLDAFQDAANNELGYEMMKDLLPEGENIREFYEQAMGMAILQAKRTYPAMLFTVSLITSTMHWLLIQFIAYVRSWKRPLMKDILNVGLSPVAAWVLVSLWLVAANLGNVDTVWTFTIESMLVVLFIMFQIIGMISLIVMIGKIGTKKIFRILLTAISIFWFIFNPTLLIMVGCLDSMFNFRKVKTLI